ncbi:RNA polymerase sigma-70 factor [Bacteroides sp. 519]|uniref:RNA polymerase sigma-70 factor n=1 Tax=Bacteroides sp. 519 TaxID=2302937 RepID=UPI0013D55565|nr:RNA polymerase sigma-70 factor [Bacteroides sp. 519]NDV58269.1 RNA polymerase sigma-70 factor [Bacteroides sp. 519]
MINDNNKISFEEIYITYFSRMKNFALEYIYSEQDSENIVQDVFMELWEKKEALTIHTNLIAYLFTATKNRCIDFLRHKVLVKEVADKLQEEHLLMLKMNFHSLEALNQDIFYENNIEDIIAKAIDTLPEKCREIFIKSKFEQKKQKEIAAELNITINTVETQMGIAYKKLKAELKEYFPLLVFLLG